MGKGRGTWKKGKDTWENEETHGKKKDTWEKKEAHGEREGSMGNMHPHPTCLLPLGKYAQVYKVQAQGEDLSNANFALEIH